MHCKLCISGEILISNSSKASFFAETVQKGGKKMTSLGHMNAMRTPFFSTSSHLVNKGVLKSQSMSPSPQTLIPSRKKFGDPPSLSTVPESPENEISMGFRNMIDDTRPKFDKDMWANDHQRFQHDFKERGRKSGCGQKGKFRAQEKMRSRPVSPLLALMEEANEEEESLQTMSVIKESTNRSTQSRWDFKGQEMAKSDIDESWWDEPLLIQDKANSDLPRSPGLKRPLTSDEKSDFAARLEKKKSPHNFKRFATSNLRHRSNSPNVHPKNRNMSQPNQDFQKASAYNAKFPSSFFQEKAERDKVSGRNWVEEMTHQNNLSSEEKDWNLVGNRQIEQWVESPMHRRILSEKEKATGLWSPEFCRKKPRSIRSLLLDQTVQNLDAPFAHTNFETNPTKPISQKTALLSKKNLSSSTRQQTNQIRHENFKKEEQEKLDFVPEETEHETVLKGEIPPESSEHGSSGGSLQQNQKNLSIEVSEADTKCGEDEDYSSVLDFLL